MGTNTKPPKLSREQAIERISELRERMLKDSETGKVDNSTYKKLSYLLETDLVDAVGSVHPIHSRLKQATHEFLASRATGQHAIFVTSRVVRQQAGLLGELLEQLKRDKDDAPALGAASRSSVDRAVGHARVEQLLKGFHRAALQLLKRHDDRTAFAIADEYDVQDLLHALLKVDFDDVRAEEWTPSYAGKSSRMDFLLKDERLVIEAKMTRKGLGEKEVGEQLIIDIARYAKHPDCKTLVCFVYDPTNRIGNPAALEKDLSSTNSGILVRVLIAPRP